MNEDLDKGPKGSSDCTPLSSLYCNLKLRITGDLKSKELENLYNCNLCNQCHLAGVNQSAREMSVKKDIIARHVAEIKENISKSRNSYGIEHEKGDDGSSNTETLLFKGCTPTHKTPEILMAAENLLKAEK